MAAKTAAKPRTKVCEVCGCIVNLRGYNGHVRFAHGELPAKIQPTNPTLEDVLNRIATRLDGFANGLQTAPVSGFQGYVCTSCGRALTVRWDAIGIHKLICLPCWEKEKA
jgi:hypothetical protein